MRFSAQMTDYPKIPYLEREVCVRERELIELTERIEEYGCECSTAEKERGASSDISVKCCVGPGSTDTAATAGYLTKQVERGCRRTKRRESARKKEETKKKVKIESGREKKGAKHYRMRNRKRDGTKR